MGRPGEITELLLQWRAGEPAVAERLFPLVYDELRRIARGQLFRGQPATLDPTELVHETYLKLVDQSRVVSNDRNHFFALAAKAMRQILVDRARKRGAAKRGGGRALATLSDDDASTEARAVEILAIDEALSKLEVAESRLARLVEVRFFGGLTVEEAADALGSSPRTAKRDWQKARAFLSRELGKP